MLTKFVKNWELDHFKLVNFKICTIAKTMFRLEPLYSSFTRIQIVHYFWWKAPKTTLLKHTTWTTSNISCPSHLGSPQVRGSQRTKGTKRRRRRPQFGVLFYVKLPQHERTQQEHQRRQLHPHDVAPVARGPHVQPDGRWGAASWPSLRTPSSHSKTITFDFT